VFRRQLAGGPIGISEADVVAELGAQQLRPLVKRFDQLALLRREDPVPGFASKRVGDAGRRGHRLHEPVGVLTPDVEPVQVRLPQPLRLEQGGIDDRQAARVDGDTADENPLSHLTSMSR
jgi:hypothetical protein